MSLGQPRMQIRHSRLLACSFARVLLALAILGFSDAWAQPQHDGNAPIEIEADSAEQNEAIGLITYRGNVEIKQAGLTISADKVAIKSDKPAGEGRRELMEIVATGQPARLVHSANDKAMEVSAEAKSILYVVQTDVIRLNNQAKLVQNSSSVSGDQIEYLIQQRRVRARALNPDKGGRVHTVISPNDEQLLPALK